MEVFHLYPKATKKDVLSELMKISKALQETIIASIVREKNVDGLTKMLSNEKEAKEEEEEIISEEE